MADGQHGPPGSAGFADVARLPETRGGDLFQNLSGQLLDGIESGLVVAQSVFRECSKPECNLGRFLRELIHRPDGSRDDPDRILGRFGTAQNHLFG